jgi:hypothetical protein
MRQATEAPIVALEQSTTSNHHLKAWASMPTATGQAIMYSGVEKKTLYAATAMPAATVSSHRAHDSAGRIYR